MARSRPPRTHRYSMQFKATAGSLSDLPDECHEGLTPNGSATNSPVSEVNMFRCEERLSRVQYRPTGDATS